MGALLKNKIKNYPTCKVWDHRPKISQLRKGWDGPTARARGPTVKATGQTVINLIMY